MKQQHEVSKTGRLHLIHELPHTLGPGRTVKVATVVRLHAPSYLSERDPQPYPHAIHQRDPFTISNTNVDA